MYSIKSNQAGFYLWPLLLFIVIISVTGSIGYMIFSKSEDKANAAVRWSYDQVEDKWFVAEGQAPKCQQPFNFTHTPVDINNVTSIALPGTYRGKSYKVHGGFALSKSSEVVLPSDATLSGMTRYYEGDPLELQYAVSFEMDCGISFYFDHLHTLSPKLQELANQLPEPKVNDTRVNPDDAPPRITMKAGEIVATETGAHQSMRYGIDFGVVDYRQRNSISSNSSWASMHNTYKASEWFGVCWFDLLPAADVEMSKRLSIVQADTRKTVKFVSDYCTSADFTTLDLYDGQPVDSY